MARKPRLEIEGGLYHVVTRGVDRRDIFHRSEDHRKEPEKEWCQTCEPCPTSTR